MQYIRTAAEAASNAAEQMRRMGFADATALLGGADGGIDVFSSGAYAQVKWRGGEAGHADVETLYGARGHDHTRGLLFFAASGYAADAIEYADSVGVGLFEFDAAGAITAINDHARRLAEPPASSGEAPSPVYVPDSMLQVAAKAAWAWTRLFWLTHWRIICAVFFTVSIATAPFGEGMVGPRVITTVIGVVGAPVFWLLYLQHRQESRDR